ncbi:MAG: hypothetical protein MUQ10_19455, partial [Anaerolineae bacterium]|nr:hypothetical protein [Anaerolineae bacterium]
WNHYIDPLAPAGLVCGLSGAGYTYPSLMDAQQLRAYLEYTASYVEETGLRVLHYDARYGPTGRISHAAAALFDEILTPAGLLGIFAADAGWPWGFGCYYAGVPMPVVRPSYMLWDGTAQATIDDLLARKPDEVFVDPAGAQMTQPDRRTYDWQNGTVVEDPNADRGLARAFSRPDMPNCCAAMWGPHSALAPGEYTIAYRLKVEDNGPSQSIARLYVTGNLADTDMELAPQSLATRDFALADQYQAFTIDHHTGSVCY